MLGRIGFALWISSIGTIHAADRNVNDVSFAKDIVPLLVEKCLSCHGGKLTEGGYSVADFELLFRQGDSGLKPISLVAPESSELLVRITSTDSSIRMPLDSEPFDASEIETISQWLLSGATVDDSTKSMPLIELYGQTKSSDRAPEHYLNRFPIASLLISEDGQSLLVGGYSEILVWSLDSQSLVGRIPTRGRMISDIKWTPNGRFVVASGAPGKFGVIELFDFATHQSIAAFGFSRDLCSSIATSPYRNEIAAGFGDGSVVLFSLERFQPRVMSVPHAAGVTNVEWSSKFNRILTASLDRTAKCFEASDGQVLFAYAEHERSVGGVASSSFGTLTLDETGMLRLWSEGEWTKSIAKFEGLSKNVQPIVCSNDVVLVADNDRIRRLQIVQKLVDEETAKDNKAAEAQKPKKKKSTTFKELESLQSLTKQKISSTTTNSRGLVAAGMDDGSVVVWNTDKAFSPWKSWPALP